MSDDVKMWLIFFCGLLVFCLFMWGMYWIVKSFSYWLFYEDMVKETIRQMVAPEYLKLLK